MRKRLPRADDRAPRAAAFEFKSLTNGSWLAWTNAFGSHRKKVL